MLTILVFGQGSLGLVRKVRIGMARLSFGVLGLVRIGQVIQGHARVDYTRFA